MTRFFYSVFFLFNRVTDEVFNFLLVWYYCTLTIRESILISNGSRYTATCKNHGKHEMSLKENQATKRDWTWNQSPAIPRCWWPLLPCVGWKCHSIPCAWVGTSALFPFFGSFFAYKAGLQCWNPCFLSNCPVFFCSGSKAGGCLITTFPRSCLEWC